MAEPGNYDAIIVGAGIAGLYQLYRLREAGLAARVIEAADGVGGTWFWNRYPGARCDVQSLSYSYSFSPELEQEWQWTEKYPTQPEILRYVNHVADRFDLRRDITFGTRVTRADWDDASASWTVHTDPGGPARAQFLIMATGCLSAAKLPEIPGLERYRGRTHHTARWGKDEVRFDGMAVGVIGTGSSGIQSIPIIARQAADLTVFQRTPNFSMPAGNRPLADTEIAEMKASYRDWREDGWVQHVAEVGAHTLFPTAESWYMGSNVPGKPRVFMAYIGGVGVYRQTCDQIAASGYEGFTLTGAAEPAAV